MAYRTSEFSNLKPPPDKPIYWTVYDKRNHQIRTRVFTKFWFDARKNGSIALMISLEHCDAVPHEKM